MGLDEGAETMVPVEIDGQTVLMSVAPGGRQPGLDLGEEQEIGWRRPLLEPVLDGLTAVARAMGTRGPPLCSPRTWARRAGPSCGRSPVPARRTPRPI
ncbi:hypothetical protein [Streptomyces sp. HUAS TT20]|uniref:hypothetical protein n=1 Tax=Streptomyces sp. HUAS TT20 TaxID=3447509 RepID=UPI0021DB63F0|nr:hypothetical protein [Streptomyces sp. HUAS 15-9]UXY31307.1 hypothetical protein N8I87_35395 [Streptomyces sp. HUAS 15-9]